MTKLFGEITPGDLKIFYAKQNQDKDQIKLYLEYDINNRVLSVRLKGDIYDETIVTRKLRKREKGGAAKRPSPRQKFAHKKKERKIEY